MKSKFPPGLAFWAGVNLLVICAGLICTSHLQAQGEQNPTGAAGSFSGSIATGGGSFDPYERNASRSVTDIVVPGAVIPFTYTRIWNSRGGWRDNWQWDIQKNWSIGGASRLGGNTISFTDIPLVIRTDA